MTLSQKHSSAWMLDSDISGCCDNIDHGPLLATLPVFTATLRRWLHAGVVGMFPTNLTLLANSLRQPLAA